MSETRFEGLPQIQTNALINISQVYESLRYNDYIKGNLFIEDVEVHQQIMAALAEK